MNRPRPSLDLICFTLMAALLLWGSDPSDTNYFVTESAAERTVLPEYKIIPAAKTTELIPAKTGFNPNDYVEWRRSHGDAASSRYSSLDQIDRQNVGDLLVAWTYHSNDGKGNIQANPIIVNGVMYAPTVGNYIVAIDASTGVEIWRFQAGDRPAFRGLVYWEGDQDHTNRLLFTSRRYLWALDAQSGKPIEEFGKGGRVPADGTVAPAIHGAVLVVPLWNVVKGFDIRSGKELWKFNLIPKKGEFGHDTWDVPERGANCWGGMALDKSRGIAFVSTGSPHPNFVGTGHHGRNLFANSVVALDANTGQRLWHFQEIRHDIWDLDIPAPPNLVTVERDGHLYDAVAQVTKMGNTLLLDRKSGEPLFPFRLRRAPVSSLPGELTWPYQPAPELPEPFAKQEFTLQDVTNISTRSRESVMAQLENARLGWFAPFEEDRPTVFYGVHGGAEWTGAAFDPSTGWLYVTANHVPYRITVKRRQGRRLDASNTTTSGAKAFVRHCSVCHGEDLEGRGMAPNLLSLHKRMSREELREIVREGRKTMPAMPQIHDVELRHLIDFLLNRNASVASSDAVEDRPRYYSLGYTKLLDHEGYPGGRPPWGTLNAIDLNSGKLVWRVPLGEHAELTRRGILNTGTENFGGATVTAGGLVFCAGTPDKRIRAFDAATGQEIWQHKLPFGAYAPPAVYEADGREFVVVASTGGGKLGGELGDAYVAFSLPVVENVNQERRGEQWPARP